MANIPGVSIDVTGDVSGLKKAAAESVVALDSITTAAQGTTQAVSEIDTASRALKNARAEYDRVRLAAAEQRDVARQAGQRLSQDIADSINKELSAARVAVARARAEYSATVARGPAQAAPSKIAPEIDTAVKSSRQLAYELQQVNFQITDIVTSLASGQNPMTVLLQQGGQLKDMFGGVRGAVSALGRGIAALITPFTVVAGVVGTLAVAFFQARKEADALALALDLSGGAAGVSGDQLEQYARNIDQVVGTIGSASAALTILAKSGAVSGDSMESIVIAAQKLEKVGGPAVEETLELFVQLGRDPVDAAIRLNKSFNFLNETTFRQIKTLQDFGDRAGAARIAQQALADTFNKTSDAQLQRLGLLERAFKSTTSAIKEFWDGLKEIGREKTGVQTVRDLEERIAALQKLLSDPKAAGSFVNAARANLVKMQAELAQVRTQIDQDEESAAAVARQNEENERRIRLANLGPQVANIQAEFSANTAAVKAALELQRATVDDEFERNLISLEDYYAKRKEITEQETAAEVRVLERQAQDLRDRLTRGVPVEQRDAVQAQLTSTEGQLTALRIRNITEITRLENERRKASLAANQALQNGVAEVERAKTLAAASASVIEQETSEAYSRGLISLQTYYSQRREILQKELAFEELLLDRQLALAREAERRAAPDAKPAARREVLNIENQIAAARDRRLQREQRLNFDAQNDAREELELGQRRILQLAELAGVETSAQANEARRNVLLQQYRVELERARQTDVVRALTLERIIELQTAEQRLVAEKTKLARDTQQFAEREQEIQFQRQQGLITEQQAQNQLFAVAQQKARVELEAYEKLKEQLGNNLTAESRRQLDAFITAAKQGLQSLTPAAIAMNNALQQGFETAINGLLTGTFKLKDAFKSLAQSVAQQFTQIISRRIAGGIFSAIAGGGFGAGLGKVFGFAEGGMVRGPGSGTSDSIPARLSNGEFVQPARTVAHYGADFMEALRRLQVPRLSLGAGGGKRFANGGLVGPANSAATAARSQDMPVQVNIQNSGQAKSATAESSFDGKGLVISVLLEDIRTNGPIYQNMSNANRLRR